MAVTWNISFFKTLAESSVSAGAAAFAASWAVAASINLHDLYIALGAGGAVAIYTFAKGLGVSQAAQAAAGKPGFPGSHDTILTTSNSADWYEEE